MTTEFLGPDFWGQTQMGPPLSVPHGKEKPRDQYLTDRGVSINTTETVYARNAYLDRILDPYIGYGATLAV